jgi:hypothetical protein
MKFAAKLGGTTCRSVGSSSGRAVGVPQDCQLECTTTTNIYIYIYIGAGIPDPQFNILKYLISEKGCEHRDESNFLPINIPVGDILQGDCSHRVRLLLKAYNVRIHSPGFPYGSDELRRRLGGHPVVRRRPKENQRYPFKCDERQTANMMCGSCNTSISLSGPGNVFHNQNQPAPMAQPPQIQTGYQGGLVVACYGPGRQTANMTSGAHHAFQIACLRPGLVWFKEGGCKPWSPPVPR